MGELEEAYYLALRDQRAHREFFRQLRGAVLAFLIPYHPEAVGEFELGNGSNVTFIVWHLNEEGFIPVFTSAERAEQALFATGEIDHRHGLAEMRGEDLFRVLALQDVPVVINPACGTGEMFLDLRAVAKVADGSILAEE
jgi:hypothetical protein